jgi:hypothetical protein
LGQSPELTRLTDELRGRLLDAGKGAAVPIATPPVESLTERVVNRVGTLADAGGKTVGDVGGAAGDVGGAVGDTVGGVGKTVGGLGRRQSRNDAEYDEEPSEDPGMSPTISPNPSAGTTVRKSTPRPTGTTKSRHPAGWRGPVPAAGPAGRTVGHRGAVMADEGDDKGGLTGALPTDALKDAGQQLLGLLVQRAAEAASQRVSGLADRLTDVTESGGTCGPW